MFRRTKLPSPAMVVACIALLVALTGSAAAVTIAAVPLAKRALLADNATRLQGKTSAALLQTAQLTAQKEAQQASAQAAQLPGPASSAAGLITIKTAAWSFPPDGYGETIAVCDAGQKAIAGGWDNPNGYAHPWDTRPTPDGGGWRVFTTVSKDATAAESGTVYAVCLK